MISWSQQGARNLADGCCWGRSAECRQGFSDEMMNISAIVGSGLISCSLTLPIQYFFFFVLLVCFVSMTCFQHSCSEVLLLQGHLQGWECQRLPWQQGWFPEVPNKPARDKEEHREGRKGVLSEHLQCHLTVAGRSSNERWRKGKTWALSHLL